MSEAIRHASFADFYPYYLTQHNNRLCRRCHFIGSSSALAAVAQCAVSLDPGWLVVALLSGYGGAWVGHFVFERNKPASFTQPWYSFRADWVMYWQMLTGKLSW